MGLSCLSTRGMRFVCRPTWVLPKGQERFARELLAERAVAS